MRDKLLQNPLPINKLAARVIKPAMAEDVFRPMPKYVATKSFSTNFLEVKKAPEGAPKEIIGKRRDRLVIVGYAKSQPKSSQSARWVVRCDCGNYEHRKKILRWLGTTAPDMCSECQKRLYEQGKEGWGREKAKRAGVDR